MGNLVGHSALKPNHGDDGQYSEDQTSSIHRPPIIRKVRRSPGSHHTFGSTARKGIEDRASSKRRHADLILEFLEKLHSLTPLD